MIVIKIVAYVVLGLVVASHLVHADKIPARYHEACMWLIRTVIVLGIFAYFAIAAAAWFEHREHEIVPSASATTNCSLEPLEYP